MSSKTTLSLLAAFESAHRLLAAFESVRHCLPPHAHTAPCAHDSPASCRPRDGGIFAARVGYEVAFPKASGININMMPISLKTPSSYPAHPAAQDALPKFAHQYAPLLRACLQYISPGECDVAYLTIHESVIEKDGESQRRPGLHVDSPGMRPSESSPNGHVVDFGRGPHSHWMFWGAGNAKTSDAEGGVYQLHGGIFMASNVSNSTRVWDTQVADACVVGAHGDCEHLRGCVGCCVGLELTTRATTRTTIHVHSDGARLHAGDLVWLTDRTLHESLPLPAGTARSYFRLVTSKISVWYSSHSTPSPLGVKPPSNVRIIAGSKFGGSSDGGSSDCTGDSNSTGGKAQPLSSKLDSVKVLGPASSTTGSSWQQSDALPCGFAEASFPLQ